MMDFSWLSGTRPTPSNFITDLLQGLMAGMQARTEREERKRRREAEELERKERSEERALRRSESEEQARIDRMTAGQFSSEYGLPVRPGFEKRTLAELRRAGLLDQAFIDPRAEARRAIDDARQAAQLYGVRTTVPGRTAAAAFPGVELPRLPGPFAEVPGVPPQGVGVPTIPGAPPPVYRGPVAPLEFGAPRVYTLGELSPAVRPEFRDLPWDPSKTIPEHYLEPRPKAKEPETPRDIADRAIRRADALRSQFLAANTPAEKIKIGQDYNRYLKDAQAELRKHGVGAIPGHAALTAAEINAAAKEVKRREPVAGGVAERLTPIQQRAITQHNTFTARADRLAAQIDRLQSNVLMDPAERDKRVAAIQKEIDGISRQQTALIQQVPSIAPYVGAVVEPAPAPALEDPLGIRLVAPVPTVPGVGPAPTPAPVPRPTRRVVSRAQVTAEAQRRGVHPNLVIQEYNRRGIMVQ